MTAFPETEVRIRSNDLKDMIRVALAAEKIEDASRKCRKEGEDYAESGR